MNQPDRLDMLRSRTARREEPLGARPGEPREATAPAAGGTEPEHEAMLADSVGLALLVVLETLAPAERVAFVLHDMFAVPCEEIGAMLDRSPNATKQLASRARRRARGAQLALINGIPAAVWAPGGNPRVIFTFTFVGGKITAIDTLADPDIVSRLDVTIVSG